ncbi:MAG: phytanoyl-CoA dioxygenase family protein [Candidatus Latescibacteria bacterium]|nr:phytanoyl-CoA dioxygenase family protein [Candidatus Latescibacterota bacterium]
MALTDALPDMERELRFYPAANTAPKVLSAEQIKHFNERGFIFPVDVFTPTEAAANRRYFDDLMERAKAAGHESYSINGWQRHCRGLYDLVHERRILDCVEDLLGPNLVNIMTHYFSKEPGDDRQVSWHQDASYWPLTPSKTMTVWLAIDDTDVDNGAMQFVPGSHRHGQIPFERSSAAEKNVLGQSVHDHCRWGDEPVAIELKAGQVSIHSDLLLHGSGANRSGRRRCGLTLRYMPPDVRTRSQDRAEGFICRGVDPSGYWVNPSVPQGENVPQRNG